MLRLRTARHDDIQLLRALLFEAAFWRPDVVRPPLEQALADPALARYVEGFGCPGDFGLVAQEGAEPLGAAWWRYFQAGEPGYGFVDEATPEASAAVLSTHRRPGTGTALLGELERQARDQGIKRLSLSVERDNRHRALRAPRVSAPRPRGERTDDGDRTGSTAIATELLTGSA